MKFILLLFLPLGLYAQPNCNAFLYRGDTLQYKACRLVENIDDKYYQFSRPFQEAYDSALAICPYFAYAYREKSVAYLKSGDFITWKKLIDRAVDYDPKGNLGYRGWCRYQFFRDYKGAIADIEKLDSLISYDIGYGINGDYHLNITKAMCHSALNNKQKAIEIMEVQLQQPGYHIGLYDHYQLGVAYFETGDYIQAIQNFDKQNKIYEMAENIYYQAKVYKLQNNLASFDATKARAIQLYKQGRVMRDPYTTHFRKVYLETIEKE